MAVDGTGERLRADRVVRGAVAGGRKAAAALAVVPLAVRGRRAVLTELETLDPEVDAERMTRLMLGSMFSDEFFQRAVSTVACWRLAAVESIAPVLTRHGFASEPGTVDRLASLRRIIPELTPDDARYLIATLCFEPARIPELLGVRGLGPKEQRALFLFGTRLGASWNVPVPDSQADFRAWSREHERRSYQRTQAAVDLAAALQRSFVARAPRALRSLAPQILRALADQPLLDAVGLPAAHPALRKVVAGAVAAYLRGRRTVPGPRTDVVSAPLPESLPQPPSPPPAPPVEGPVEAAADEPQVDESRPAPSSRPSRRKVM